MFTKYALRDLAVEVLRAIQIPLSADEIWEYAEKYGFNERVDSILRICGSKTNVAD